LHRAAIRIMERLVTDKEEAPFARKLCSIAIPDIESFPRRLALPGRRFVLLLACDARGVSDSAITAFADSMIDRGLAYLCAWGPECERVHDLFDLAHVTRGVEGGREHPHIMTTWHDDETLDEALWFMLNSACPDEGLAETCEVDLAVSVANDEWDAHIRRRLSDLGQLSEDVLSMDRDS